MTKPQAGNEEGRHARRLEVSEEGHEWKEAWRGLGTSAKIGGLTPGRPHQVRVAASNAVGEGAFSKAAAFSTLLLAPPAPLHLQADASKECALQLCPLHACFSRHQLSGTISARDEMIHVTCMNRALSEVSCIGLKERVAGQLLQTCQRVSIMTNAASVCRPPSLSLRWTLPEADSAHAEAACHEIEATALPESGTAHSIHSKAPGKAAEQEVTDVQPGLTYEVCVNALHRNHMALCHAMHAG